MVTILQELELQEDTLLQYSILLNIATKLELQKATDGAKLELLEATLVTLESYTRRCTVRGLLIIMLIMHIDDLN